MKKMFNDILFCCELTTCRNNTAFMNKWQPNEYQIDYNIARCLTNTNILELDSGNWETGEEHYRLDRTSNLILKRINFLKYKVNFANIDNDTKNKMLHDISEIELRYNRKIKIKKLNNL